MANAYWTFTCISLDICLSIYGSPTYQDWIPTYNWIHVRDDGLMFHGWCHAAASMRKHQEEPKRCGLPIWGGYTVDLGVYN